LEEFISFSNRNGKSSTRFALAAVPCGTQGRRRVFFDVAFARNPQPRARFSQAVVDDVWNGVSSGGLLHYYFRQAA